MCPCERELLIGVVVSFSRAFGPENIEQNGFLEQYLEKCLCNLFLCLNCASQSASSFRYPCVPTDRLPNAV